MVHDRIWVGSNEPSALTAAMTTPAPYIAIDVSPFTSPCTDRATTESGPFARTMVRTSTLYAMAAHSDTSRVDTEQRLFLREGNLGLDPPLEWQTYGDTYRIAP